MVATLLQKNPVALTTRALFSQTQDSLRLSWWAGDENSAAGFVQLSFQYSELGLAGYFNSMHANQAQILGASELTFIKQAKNCALDDVLKQLFSEQCAAIFISDNLTPPKIFKEYAYKYDLPVLCSSLSSNELIDQLQYYLTQSLAKKEILHGVFMEVINVGVLITGKSGSGKSELALELISRGHRLIADDAPEFSRIAPYTINGTCPDLLKNFLEVRGLGILNIRKMYGDSAIISNKYLQLIIDLLPAKKTVPRNETSVKLIEKTTSTLGVDIPTITLPIAPGRNLAVLVEAAVRDHLLIKGGYNAGDDFVRRQKLRCGKS